MQHADPDDDGNLTCWLCHRVGEPESFQPFTQKERLGHRRFSYVRVIYYRCVPDCLSRARDRSQEVQNHNVSRQNER